MYRNGWIQCYYITRAYGSSAGSMRAFSKISGGEHLPRNPNKSGPLTELPDYTFLDGRVTPLGANQTKRLAQQQEIAGKIVTMTREMDFAVERYKKMQEDEQQKCESIVSQKLKPKGFSLLSK